MDFLMDFSIVEDEQKKRLSASPPSAIGTSSPHPAPLPMTPLKPTTSQLQVKSTPAVTATAASTSTATSSEDSSTVTADTVGSFAPSTSSSPPTSSIVIIGKGTLDTAATLPSNSHSTPSTSNVNVATAAKSSSASTASSSSVPASSAGSTASSSASSSSAETASLWLTLLRIRECFVYAVPPRVGLTPYHAESWGLDKPISTGELHVIAQEGALLIRFYDQKTHALFAQTVELNCLDFHKNPSLSLDSFIEPVRDSSRYFVVRIKHPRSGAVTSIGIGFRERVSAFDLSAAITDRIKSVGRHYSDGTDTTAIDSATAAERERKEIELAEQRLAQNHQDLSLKQGQRITVALKSMNVGGPGGPGGDQKPKKKPTTGGISLVASGSGFILAPPPAALDANAIEQSTATEGMGRAAPSAANLSPNQSPVAASAANEPPDFELNRVRAGDDEGDSERALEGQGEHQAPLEGHPASINPAADDEEDEFTDFASAN